jgi:four helix bundle protein
MAMDLNGDGQHRSSTPISSFRDLRVWRLGMDLVEEVYRLTRSFPRFEVYGLAGQMQRAAVSVPSNVAEGHSRQHTREYLHHVSMAQASLAELETQVEIAARLDYLTDEQRRRVLDAISGLGRQLHSLRAALNQRPPR